MFNAITQGPRCTLPGGQHQKYIQSFTRLGSSERDKHVPDATVTPSSKQKATTAQYRR